MFKDEWLRMPKYSWVRKAVKCTEFRCQICETTCKLSDLGYAALDSHARGQKHKTKEQSKEQTNNFFSPKSQASNFQASSASTQVPEPQVPQVPKPQPQVHLHHPTTARNGAEMQKLSGVCTA